MSTALALPASLEAATRHQPAARAALAAALSNPSHAYLMSGPLGAGPRDAARAFVAELIADGAPDPDDAHRRAMLDPSPHPDLVWLRPPGGQHLVEEVRERVIRAAAYRPFEGERRAFVIEAAEAMADESQNALLKTLEEPAPFVHIVLLSADPAGILPTVASRCQSIPFGRIPPDAVKAILTGEGAPDSPELAASARLCGGDPDVARMLITPAGRELRAAAERCAAVARTAEFESAPWRELIALCNDEGERSAARLVELASAQLEDFGLQGAQAAKAKREAEAGAKRIARQRRTELLTLALGLIASWFRDLAAVRSGAEGQILNADRAEPLSASPVPAAGPCLEAAEIALETARRLQVNVSEELALEALVYRAAALLEERGSG